MTSSEQLQVYLPAVLFLLSLIAYEVGKRNR